MLTNLSNLGSPSAYTGQQVYVNHSQASGTKDQTKTGNDTVDISREARSLQQNYQEKEDRLEDRYQNDTDRLEREFLQEKTRLQQEYHQKRQSLGINLFA